MIVLIAGASHTGKTLISQKLMEKYGYPYLSIDHLKMGLIRSKNTNLTPLSDDKDLTIENKQNLIVEGCYIPFDWQKDFGKDYLEQIKYYCLVFSENYIKNNFDNIKKYANVIEGRLADDCDLQMLLKDNKQNLELAKRHNLCYILIENEYKIDIEL